MKLSIGIVLPAYNEGTVIGSVLDSLPKTIKSGKTEYKTEVIVVNDGSIDDTSKIVSQRTHVHLINHILNSGAGAATRTGLHYAKQLGCTYVVTMDSDGQHDSKDVTKLLKYITNSQADFVIGSRLLNSDGMPWYRILGNKGLSFITFLMFGVLVTDSQSGLKILNQKAMKSLSFHSNNYAFCSEMIWQAKKNNLVIREIPVAAIYTDYSLAKGQSNWDAIHIIRQLIKRRFMDFLNG